MSSRFSARADARSLAERLLDDHAAEVTVLLREAGLAELVGDLAEERWRRGQIEERVVLRLVLRVDLFDLRFERRVRLRIGEVAADVVDALLEPLPVVELENFGIELGDVALDFFPEFVVAHRLDRDADDGEVLIEQAVFCEVHERRHELSLREVAGRAEDDHRARRCADVGRRVDVVGHEAFGVVGHWVLPLNFAICCSAASTTRSVVNPNLTWRSLSGADAPNPSMPIIAPVRPA